MAAPSVARAGWYAAWIPRSKGKRLRRVLLFCFHDQERQLVCEHERRVVPLSHASIAGARLVGPFGRPEAAEAALRLSVRSPGVVAKAASAVPTADSA